MRPLSRESKRTGGKLRFAFTALRYHPNQFHVVRTLLSRGHPVAFYCMDRGLSDDYSILAPELLRRSRLYEAIASLLGKGRDQSFRLRFGFPAVREFREHFVRYGPDVVVIRDPGTLFGLLSALLTRRFGAKVLFYSQTPKYRSTRRAKDTVVRRFISFFDAPWVTPVRGDRAGSYTPSPRMFYQPFPMQESPRPKAQWCSCGKVNLLCVGKFMRRKNHLLLLEAVRELRRSYRISLTILGASVVERPAYEAVCEYIRSAGLEQTVRLQSHVPHPRMPQEYVKHDLFVLPSSNEPASISQLEAMACGLPVICSDSNGTSCYIEHGRNGYVFRSGDRADLVAKIAQAVASSEKLRQMGRRSLEIVRTRHAPERFYRDLMRIIAEG